MAMATTSSLEIRVTEIATCPICWEDIKDPRSLPCVHSFCLQCLQGHFKGTSLGDDVPCPVCRKEFQIPQEGLPALPHNFFLRNLVDAKNAKHEPQCSSCEPCCKEGQTESATVYCVDCSQKLCDRCSVPHKNWSCGAHDVRPVGDELSTELIWRRGSYCDRHPDKRLDLYCYDCKVNFCINCFAISHQQHKCEEAQKVATFFAALIQSEIEPFPNRISRFREALRQADLASEKFLENVEKLESEVLRKGDEIKALVDDHVARVVQELHQIKANSAKESQASEEDFKLAVTALESFQAYASELTSKGSACDITRAANDLQARATELLKTYVTNGDRYCPPQFEFVPADVEKMTAETIIGSLVASDAVRRVPPLPKRSEQARAVRHKSIESTRRKFKLPVRSKTTKRTESQSPARRLDQEAVRQKYLQSSPQVVHTFPEAEDVRGVTLLNNELYVLRQRNIDQVDVYSTIDFTLLHRLSALGTSTDMRDITSLAPKQCVYIADWGNTCIHQVGLDASVSKWPVKGKPQGLSVTPSCNLLVTCRDMQGRGGKLIELSSKNGKVVREMELDFEWPWHCIHLANNQYVVCYGTVKDSGASMVGSDGKVLRSNLGDGGLQLPYHTAADEDEFIFVADNLSQRIALFDPSLNYVRDILQQMEHGPWRLCFDAVTRRLYVGQGDGIVSVVQT